LALKGLRPIYARKKILSEILKKKKTKKKKPYTLLKTL